MENLHPDYQLWFSQRRLQELRDQAREEHLARCITGKRSRKQDIWQKIMIEKLLSLNHRKKVSLANRYREPEKDGQRLAKQIARNYCRLQSLGFPREIAAIKAWVCHKETGGIEC